MKVDARALAWVRLQVSGVAPRPLADGKGFVFTRRLAGGIADWLLAVPKPGGGWDVDPVRLDHKDYNPTFTADGRTVVFQSDRPGGREAESRRRRTMAGGG